MSGANDGVLKDSRHVSPCGVRWQSGASTPLWGAAERNLKPQASGLLFISAFSFPNSYFAPCVRLTWTGCDSPGLGATNRDWAEFLLSAFPISALPFGYVKEPGARPIPAAQNSPFPAFRFASFSRSPLFSLHHTLVPQKRSLLGNENAIFPEKSADFCSRLRNQPLSQPALRPENQTALVGGYSCQ